MRLAGILRKSVVFFGKYKDGEFKAGGTGFFAVGRTSDRIGCTYLITARHVAKQLASDGIILRINTKGGGAREVRNPQFEWVFHSDEENVDVAAAISAPHRDDDVFAVPLSVLLTDFKQGSKRVEAGAPVYVAGLFNLFAGQKKNIPVVHTGHVALLPEDEAIPVQNRWTGGRSMARAYLVQVQTLGGSSGSPVFIRRSVKTLPLPKPYEDTGIFPEAFGATWLLGVWQGAWEGPPDGNVQQNFNVGPNSRVPVSFGIVERAERIKDILESPTMAAKRAKMKAEKGKEMAEVTTPAFIGSTGKKTDEAMRRMLKTMLDTHPKPRKANWAKKKRT